ncbi:MAG: UDP-N-acetylmuramoyl-L-alanine--D-glutamate ligase, partial [Candidatus Omnitrophica bacterium]|nr:UDP-N-acetylmuramoyl-L-alanine--D-glutamate ligase [Candidatus Omnitrophota bacterium]
MELKNKKVTVAGIGESGKSAALFLKEQGAEVYVTDCGSSLELNDSAKELKSAGISVEIGRHSRNFIEGASLLVVSPGVPKGAAPIKWAEEAGIEIIGEIELAFRFCKGKVIAVTGTNGKSTTVNLITAILTNAGRDVILCGNIGDAFCRYINKISKDTMVVLEVSSFQLEYITTFKPYISIILNISQNHLDRHRDMDEYSGAKRKIYQYQDENDFVILNYDDENLKTLKNKITSKVFFFSRKHYVKGAYSDKNNLFLNITTPQVVSTIDSLKLKQPHNIENFLASSLAAHFCGVRPDVINEALKNFKGLSHRLELVANINGVNYIDDSKSTTVDSTRAALRSLKNKAVLIAGGKDKESNFNLAVDDIKQKVKTLILIGEAREKISKALSEYVDTREAQDMEEAVNIASEIAAKPDTVLLSPMCASFDMYKDYK